MCGRVLVMRLEAMESAFLSLTYCWHSGPIKKPKRSDKHREEDRKMRLAVLSDKDAVQIPDDFNMSPERDTWDKKIRANKQRGCALYLHTLIYTGQKQKTFSWHLYWAFWDQNQMLELTMFFRWTQNDLNDLNRILRALFFPLDCYCALCANTSN